MSVTDTAISGASVALETPAASAKPRRRLDPRVKSIIDEAVQVALMNLFPTSAKSVRWAVIDRIHTLNSTVPERDRLRFPSLATVKRALAAHKGRQLWDEWHKEQVEEFLRALASMGADTFGWRKRLCRCAHARSGEAK